MDKKPPVLSRRLSGIDAAFLYLERKEIPLNIAAVGIFDGPLPFREFVANIDSKLDLVPRYRQVVVPPPFNLGYPTWEYDPYFDIKRHIFRVHLDAPGGDAELEALASRLLSQSVGSRQAALGNPRRGRLAGRARRLDRAHSSRAGRRRRRSRAAENHASIPRPKAPTPHASREPARRFPHASSTRSPSRSAAPFRAPWKTRSPPRRACSAWPTGCSATAARTPFRNSPPCCRNCSSRPSGSPSTSPVRATASSAGRKSISTRCRRFAPPWAAR